MTNVLGIIIFGIVVIYSGMVIGFLYQCDNINALKHAYKAVPYIPLLLAMLFFAFLMESIEEKNLKYIISFLRTPDKGLVILACYEKIYMERKMMPRKAQYIKPSMKRAAEIAKPLFALENA